MPFSLTDVIVGTNILLSVVGFYNPAFLSKMVFNPYQVVHRNEWHRIVSHAFIHGDFLHLFFNMYVLYSFGGQIEQIFTNQRIFNIVLPDLNFWGVSSGYLYYVMLYFGALIFATLPAIKKHQNNPGYNSLGASGAVSAIVIAFILILPTTDLRLFFVPIDIPAFILGIAYLAFEYYMSKKGRTGIAHDAHFWGAIFGLVLLLVLKPAFAIHFAGQVGAFLGLVN